MADEFFVAGGLNSSEMATFAEQMRSKCQITTSPYVDIIAVLEFEIPKIVPGFKLVIRRDVELDDLALTTPNPPRIYVRESVYEFACDGDANCRELLAHELGHLLLHGDKPNKMNSKYTPHSRYTQQFSGLNSLNSTERQADMFARHFLIPMTLAFAHRHDPKRIAEISKTTLRLAGGSATMSTRPEFYHLRQPREAPSAIASSKPIRKQFDLFQDGGRDSPVATGKP
jgi:hypothetical protein